MSEPDPGDTRPVSPEEVSPPSHKGAVTLPDGTPPGSILSIIERAALDPRFDVEKLERMLAMYERMQATEALRAYNEAMNAAQTEIEPVARTAKGQNNFYAKLEDIDRRIRPIYTGHGFSLSDNAVAPLKPGNIRLECLCMHKSGHTERFYREAAPDMLGPKGSTVKTELHGIGSTETFLRRYLRCGVFNVVFEDLDDDGNGGPISAKEVDQILKGLEDGQVNPVRFLKYMRLPSTVGEMIATIRKSDLGKALNAIDELVRRQANANPS